MTSRVSFKVFGLLLLTSVLFACSAMERARTLEDEKRQWLQNQVIAENIESASREELTEEFHAMGLHTKPHPEPFHLYLLNRNGTTCILIRDEHIDSEAGIRLYGVAGEQPNYVTTGGVELTPPTKQAFVEPLPNAEVAGARAPGSGKTSSSYPDGCDTHYLMTTNGGTWQFQKGHLIPYRDTKAHAGVTSTLDPENFVPHEWKFNIQVRNCLEAFLRKQGWEYRDISVYHKDHLYPTSRGRDVPVPEGSLILAYDKTGQIRRSYYFPNFVDYTALSKEDPTLNAEKFRELYELPGIEQWFVTPAVKRLDTHQQEDQSQQAEDLAKQILETGHTLFEHHTFDMMPGRARVALLTMLLEWNMQAAATLSFTDHRLPICLAHFYCASDVLRQLDDRTDEEQNQALTACLRDQGVSAAAKDIIRFLRACCSDFRKIQEGLLIVIKQLQKLDQEPDILKSQQELDEDDEKNRPTRVIAIKDRNDEDIEMTYTLKTLHQENDLAAFKRVLGGMAVTNPVMAQKIIGLVEKRSVTKALTTLDKLRLVNFYTRYPHVQNDEKSKLWTALLKSDVEKLLQRADEEAVTLDEIRDMIDLVMLITPFYAQLVEQYDEEEHAYWLRRFLELKDREKEIKKWVRLYRALKRQTAKQKAQSLKPPK